jgi:hypothetical protein
MMNDPIRRLRLILGPVALGVTLAALPIGFTQDRPGAPFRFGPAAAFADEGRDDDREDRIEDRRDRIEEADEENENENSGPGGGDEKDDDEENSGPGGRGEDEDDVDPPASDDSPEDEGEGAQNDDDDGPDDDNSGSGSGDDGREDDDDGTSGPGGTPDRSGNGGGDDDPAVTSSANDPQRSLTAPGGNGNNFGRMRNITVTYPDGWVERIINGEYELFDNLNRRVVRRDATQEDFDRMMALL